MTGLDRLSAAALIAADTARPPTMQDQVWYVAHPLRPTDTEVDRVAEFATWRVQWDEAFAGATRENLRRAKRWLAWLRATYPAITFIAPWITAVESGADDSDPEQRARGLRDDVRVIRRCTGIVLCGGRVSSGMQTEADAAANVIDLTELGQDPPRNAP